jgi:hypothetical protein
VLDAAGIVFIQADAGNCHIVSHQFGYVGRFVGNSLELYKMTARMAI